MERDGTYYTFSANLAISTHTLTWSVTLDVPQEIIINQVISTHTLTWSVTRRDNMKVLIACDFNSHAHVERDEEG